MKKIVSLVVLLACVAGVDLMAVQVKNNLAYGVAKKDPSSGKITKIVNICTVDVRQCNFGTVTVDDVAIPRDQLSVPLAVAGVNINAGETKEVGPGVVKKDQQYPLIYLSAYYTIAPGTRFPVPFIGFASKSVLIFPDDFTRVE